MTSTGDKIVNSAYEKDVIRYYKVGLTPYTIAKKLQKDHDFSLSPNTVRAYIENHLINNEATKEKIKQEIIEHKKEIQQLKEELPENLKQLLDRKTEHIKKLNELIKKMKTDFGENEKGKKKLRLMNNKDKLRFYEQIRKTIQTIHEIENYQDKYLTEYNIQQLVNDLSIRLLNAVWELVIPYINSDSRDEVIGTFRREYINILNDFRIKIN